jgi:hypothetical protein
MTQVFFPRASGVLSRSGRPRGDHPRAVGGSGETEHLPQRPLRIGKVTLGVYPIKGYGAAELGTQTFSHRGIDPDEGDAKSVVGASVIFSMIIRAAGPKSAFFCRFSQIKLVVRMRDRDIRGTSRKSFAPILCSTFRTTSLRLIDIAAILLAFPR